MMIGPQNIASDLVIRRRSGLKTYKSMVVKKGGERTMELLKRLVVEEEGQGLVEYTLIVLLVALVFWVAVRATNADQALSSAWTNIVTCLGGPFAC
jgi:Flp pilus assembly pilin Flp